MEYVMVPVPEELVDAVQHFLIWGGDRTKEPWDEQSILDVVGALDERCSEVVERVASAALARAPRSILELASELGREEREVLGTVLEINAVHPPATGRNYFLVLRPGRPAGPGKVPLYEQVVAMENQVAARVLQARRGQ